MSKGFNGASDFARMFKSTKLAQLPDKLGDLGRNKSGAFPTHQIIESLPSSFSRRDFGLKLRLPTKLKTRYVVVNDFDNKYQLPDFEPLSGYYWKKLRFQEFGIPIAPKNNILTGSSKPKPNPLFPSKNVSAEDQNIAEALNLEVQPLESAQFQKLTKPALRKLRKPFMEWLVKTYPERLTQTELSKEIVEFIKTTNTTIKLDSPSSTSSTEIPSSYAEKLSGTAGLSYNLKGRLFQTPNGIQSSRVLPGRFLQGKPSGNSFGLGGFVGTSTLSQSQVKYLNMLLDTGKPLSGTETFSRELRIPLRAKSASLHLEKHKLELEVEPIRAPTKFSGATLSSYKRGISPRSPIGGSDKDNSVLSSLLGLLESTNKKQD